MINIEIFAPHFQIELSSKNNQKVLNRSKKKLQPNIDYNILFEFFLNLNALDTNEQQSVYVNVNPSDSNEHINGHITAEEILYVFKIL